MLNINYNNKNSYTDLGLVIETKPIIPSPAKNIYTYEIDGLNGILTEDLGTYKSIEIPISFGIIEKSNFYEKATVIKDWLLNNSDDDKLIFSDNNNYFYKVKYVNVGNIEREMQSIGRFTASFVCEPFLYFLQNDAITVTSSGTTITNLGTVPSEPQIKVYGSGDVVITVNNITSFEIKNLDAYAIIDTVLKDCYKDKTLINNICNGEFLLLDIGNNNITWTGNVNKLEITPNWRRL